MHGMGLMRLTKLTSGTIYPLLAQLERSGLVTAQWEVADPSALRRPRRRNYSLTHDGALRIDASSVNPNESCGM
jgi:DNA-binding PadR family transcriptional regulator